MLDTNNYYNIIKMEEFNSQFSEFRNSTDKFESLYIFVVYNITVETFIEKINKIIGLVDQIANPHKKNYIRNKLVKISESFEGTPLDTILNNVFLLNDKFHHLELRKEWKKNLIDFDCDNFVYKRANEFDLEWLRDYLLDISYIHILHLKSNQLKHYYLNTTKKKLFNEIQSKSFNLEEYIGQTIKAKTICVIHGVSIVLKNTEHLETDYIRIFRTDIKDDEILDIVEKINNDRNLIKLQNVFAKILDPKEGKKIVFGKDISSNIQNKMLQTLYCTPKKLAKLKENIDPDLLIFEIIIIRSFSNADSGRQLIDDFGGVIGVTFY